MAKSANRCPINELGNSLKRFHTVIKQNPVLNNVLEVAIISFNSTVEVIQEPSLTTEFDLPELQAAGPTQLITGVRRAIQLVQERKQWYKKTETPYLRPWIILITSGAVDGSHDVKDLAKDIEAGTKNKEYVFLPVGVEGANMDTLDQIAGYTKKLNGDWDKMKAMKLKDVDIFDFYTPRRSGISGIIGSDADTTDLPSLNWWGGHTVE